MPRKISIKIISLILLFLIISGRVAVYSDVVTLPESHRFYHKPEPNKLIVFVHGIRGNPVET